MSYGGGHGTVDASISHNNASALGNGLSVDFGVVFSHPLGVVVAGAGVSAGAVALDGSIDGTNWYEIATPVTTGAPGVFLLRPVIGHTIPARYVRTRISTVITGGTVSTKVGAGA